MNADTYVLLNFKNMDIWLRVFSFSLMWITRGNKAKVQNNLEFRNANPHSIIVK